MSERPEDELATLVADLRALAMAGEAAGWELPGESAPDASDSHSVESGLSGGAAWSALARDGRAAPPTGAEALRAIREDIGDCRRCALSKGRRNIVFGVGDPEADLVVIGEAPGYHEDRRGEPFVGAAGEMLDKMLVNVLGLERSSTYILNVVKCRPPNNRDPEPSEVSRCRPFLERQLDALQPKVVLVLGSVALRTLFDDPRARITRERGQWREYRGVPVLPTFHPAYLLRQPQDKRQTFADLKALRTRYDELGGRR
ncbi:MAG: uracil-DNA glycosylase family 4 [Myxococcota bacterium]|jgi:uracil-DNA glycosylase family 4